MPKQSVTVSQTFHNRVTQYQQQRNLRTWSQALIELASLGMVAQGVIVPDHETSWGGKREGAGRKKHKGA